VKGWKPCEMGKFLRGRGIVLDSSLLELIYAPKEKGKLLNAYNHVIHYYFYFYAQFGIHERVKA